MLALMTFVTVAAKPARQQLQLPLRGPTSHSEAAVSGEVDAETSGTQVEIVVCVRVPTDTAAISLAEEVTAELGSSGDVGDVAAQTVAQEGPDSGAVMLQKHKNC